MAGDITEVARYLRRLEQRIAALERLEHGSGGGSGLDFDDIDSLSPIASLALDDTLAVYDESASAAGKATVQKMWDSLGALGVGSPEENDLFVFADASDDVTKRTEIANIWNIVNGFPQASELGDDDYFYAFTEDIGGHSRIQPPKIFDYIKTKDGTGSGLDADLLEGSHASAFAAASHSHDASAITSGTIDDARIPSGIARDSEVAAAYAAISHTHTTANITDYEVNSWTPGLTIGGSATGITYAATNGGVYTKIGRYVHIAFRLVLSSKGSNTGAAVLTGLPFSISSSSPSTSNMRFYNLAWLVNVSTSPNGFVVLAGIPGSSTIALTIQETTGTGGNLTNAHLAYNSDLRGELWYLTD